MIGKTAERHTSEEFVAFLSTVVATQPADREIHIIADNLSAHKTEQVAAFLEAHPRCTPLHPDLQLVAEPGRAVVQQDRARPARPRHLHVGHRPRAQDPAVHHQYNAREAGAMGVSRSDASHRVILHVQLIQSTSGKKSKALSVPSIEAETKVLDTEGINNLSVQMLVLTNRQVLDRIRTRLSTTWLRASIACTFESLLLPLSRVLQPSGCERHRLYTRRRCASSGGRSRPAWYRQGSSAAVFLDGRC